MTVTRHAARVRHNYRQENEVGGIKAVQKSFAYDIEWGSLQQSHLETQRAVLVQHRRCIACKGIVSHIQMFDGAVLKPCTACLMDP